jgi:hypothetical protein
MNEGRGFNDHRRRRNLVSAKIFPQRPANTIAAIADLFRSLSIIYNEAFSAAVAISCRKV